MAHRDREAIAAADAPPLVLPGEHFAAGIVWLVAASAGLIAVAPTLAAGGFVAPRAIAVAHGFTLGWITTSIFGALYQLFPVVLGVSARSVGVGHATFWTLQAGTLLLVAGAWRWRPVWLAAGWVVLFFAVGGLSWNLLPERRRAPRGRTIGRYVSAAHMGLGVAMFVVAARLGDALGWWRVDRLGMLAAHVHLAVLGFGTLTAVGVGSKLLPMFLLAHGHIAWPMRWIGPLALGGLALYAPGTVWGVTALVWTGAALMAAGVFLYLVQAASYFRRRARRRLDPGLALVAAAFVFLAAALPVGALLLVRGPQALRLAAAYGVLGVIGWLGLLVVGMYYKIVPFLTWLACFSPRVGEAGVPTVADLTVPALGWASLVALAGGTVAAAVGIVVGSGAAARAGAVLLLAGALLTAVQHGRVLFVRGRP